VAADGRVLVGDFGLSITTLARADATADQGGVILGTPGFASPEQLRGDSLDVRSDIYSVGATLYYLLAGKAPFDDPDLRTMMTRVATEPPPARSTTTPPRCRRCRSTCSSAPRCSTSPARGRCCW
jgi:eukaryotic-like serine/threonine-protein kinase